MREITNYLFKTKFSKAVAQSAIITAVFFATIDQFVNTILKNTGIFIMAMIVFYGLFHIFAFEGVQR